jgi:DNA-binding transcriptional LysR family regulator
MPFDLQHLHAFATIIETGSLGRAAVALNITQPALSRTIKRLEDQVGAPLFERHSKGMQLTDIGGVLLPHATLLLRESAHASEEINAMRGLAKGTIRVGALGSIACLALPQAIDRVLAKWPKLRVFVVEGVWDRLAEALVKHEIDLALGVSAVDTAEIIAIKDCRWNDRSYVVAGMDHPLRRKQELRLADVIGERWTTTPKGTAPYEHMEQVFAAQGLGMPEILVETRSVMMLKNLVAQSGFLTWLPEPMYQAEIKAQMLDALPIPGLTGTRTMTAFRRREGILPSPAVKLLEELRLLTMEHQPGTP